MSALDRLLENNASWAEEVLKRDPEFFINSAGNPQTPPTLWIGCSDSRVPESVITASKPGDIFVHRNIANQFHLEDDSVSAVLRFAVDAVRVKHVIIVGHTLCGGAKACLAASQSPDFDPSKPIATVGSLPASDPLNVWLDPLTRLAASPKISTAPPAEALSLLVNENVRKQVDNLATTDVIKGAWARDQEVSIHGWVYELETGRLRDLEISQGPTYK